MSSQITGKAYGPFSLSDDHWMLIYWHEGRKNARIDGTFYGLTSEWWKFNELSEVDKRNAALHGKALFGSKAHGVQMAWFGMSKLLKVVECDHTAEAQLASMFRYSLQEIEESDSTYQGNYGMPEFDEAIP